MPLERLHTQAKGRTLLTMFIHAQAPTLNLNIPCKPLEKAARYLKMMMALSSQSVFSQAFPQPRKILKTNSRSIWTCLMDPKSRIVIENVSNTEALAGQDIQVLSSHAPRMIPEMNNMTRNQSETQAVADEGWEGTSSLPILWLMICCMQASSRASNSCSKLCQKAHQDQAARWCMHARIKPYMEFLLEALQESMSGPSVFMCCEVQECATLIRW